jgi:hypothetical protein
VTTNARKKGSRGEGTFQNKTIVPLKQVYGLTEEAQKVVRIQKCKQLLKWHADNDIILNEKIFQLQEYKNQHNDRVYAVSLASKRNSMMKFKYKFA